MYGKQSRRSGKDNGGHQRLRMRMKREVDGGYPEHLCHRGYRAQVVEEKKSKSFAGLTGFLFVWEAKSRLRKCIDHHLGGYW